MKKMKTSQKNGVNGNIALNHLTIILITKRAPKEEARFYTRLGIVIIL